MAGTVFCHASHGANDVTRSVFAMAATGGGRGSDATPGWSRGAEIPRRWMYSCLFGGSGSREVG